MSPPVRQAAATRRVPRGAREAPKGPARKGTRGAPLEAALFQEMTSVVLYSCTVVYVDFTMRRLHNAPA